MESMSDLKINLINLIANISDQKKLTALYTIVKSELELTATGTPQKEPVDKFEQGKIIIRRGITKDQVFQEQKKQSISFQEVQAIMTKEPWELTLEELLATLN